MLFVWEEEKKEPIKEVVEEQFECIHCGKLYSKRGIATHEKYCKEAPSDDSIL